MHDSNHPNEAVNPSEPLLGVVFKATADDGRYIEAKLFPNGAARIDTFGCEMEFPSETDAVCLRNKLVRFVVNSKFHNDLVYSASLDKVGVMAIVDLRDTAYGYSEEVVDLAARSALKDVLDKVLVDTGRTWIKVGGMELTPYGMFPADLSFAQRGMKFLQFSYERPLSVEDYRVLAAALPKCDVLVNKERGMFCLVGSQDDFYLMDIKHEQHASVVPYPAEQTQWVGDDVSAYLATDSGEEESKPTLAN